MESNDVLSAGRSGWIYLVGGLLVGLAASWALLGVTPPKYESTTRLFVSIPAETGSSALDEGMAAQQRVSSYAELLKSRAMANAVIDDLGLDLTPAQVAERVEAEAVANTSVLTVTVTDTSPERARDIAGSLDAQLPAQIDRLETDRSQSAPAVLVRVIDPPLAGGDSVSPRPLRFLGLGAVLGVLAGLAAAVVRDRRDTTVKDEHDVVNATGSRLFGAVCEDRQLREGSVPALEESSAEAARAMANHLQFLDAGRMPQVIAVTSTSDGEGRTTLAVILAAALAESGRRVVLVEADLRRPRLAGHLGLAEGPRLADVLSGAAQWQEAMQPGAGGVMVLTAGPPSDHPGALGAEEMRRLLTDLRATYEFVVLDCPPLLAVAEAAMMSALADGCLVAARYGVTRRAQLAEAAAALARLDARVLGVVLNRVPRAVAVRAGYAYASVPDARWRLRRQDTAGAGPTVDGTGADSGRGGPRTLVRPASPSPGGMS